MFGLIALAIASAFAGAAIYINIAEHPARLKLEDGPLLSQWKPAYKAGFAMQATLAVASAGCAAMAFWADGNWLWLVGGALILANWPFTLIVIMPTNHQLMALDAAAPNPLIRPLIRKWGRLHAVRSMLGLIATIIFFIAAA